MNANKRAIVNVSTGGYKTGASRLRSWCDIYREDYVCWWDEFPPNCPTHAEVPYAFKCAALREAAKEGYTTLLWADASVYCNKDSLQRVWDLIAKNGYWISLNGHWISLNGHWISLNGPPNAEWTSPSAYQYLFPGLNVEEAIELNKSIPHVMATAFGLDLTNVIGKRIFDEYCRLGLETDAFKGAWKYNPPLLGLCHGHRHDQSALSVVAWKLNCEYTKPPDIIGYAQYGITDDTVLVCQGI